VAANNNKPPTPFTSKLLQALDEAFDLENYEGPGAIVSLLLVVCILLGAAVITFTTF
jgi:hypothetical protein